MKFSSVLLATAAAAYNTTDVTATTVIETITSCEESGPCHTVTLTTTYCPENSTVISTFTGAAAAGHANVYVAGVAALAAGAMLL
ncbi:hypothetical protein FOA43_002482 [Brettanomyces nanus]|uniref:Uncharacterized protein n=1 Tax=Eeniella nana TaxID=13502 RepID=A0A875S2F8_EENNA|nr:uncharacterized protein FOA43_002482 [Brettanomyces nanus]QPG75138.1 hypothetical protein FOA43_002482 [Brettanomyces nanus]